MKYLKSYLFILLCVLTGAFIHASDAPKQPANSTASRDIVTTEPHVTVDPSAYTNHIITAAPSNNSLTFSAGGAVITLKPDGTVDIGNKTLPEAAKAFWEAVTKASPDFRASIVTAELTSLRTERDAAKARIVELENQVAQLNAAAALLQVQRNEALDGAIQRAMQNSVAPKK